MSFGNCYKGKKVLLTGHTGFKGSWMAIWLKQLGADVYGFALAPTSDLDNFVTCGLENEIHHQEGDVRDAKALASYFAKVQPDIAFHLAAQPLVLLSYQDPVGTFETNLMGVINFFEAVRHTPSVKVAINVTSDKCYDNKEWVWGYRENDPMGGKDPYSASKGCAELITSSYIHSYFSNSGCHVASARAGNVIGGGDWAKDRIVPDYFRAAKAGEKLTIRNPYATRPWQHVLEPLSGYLNLGASMYNEGIEYSGGWNFGPEDTANYSVKQLIDKMLLIDPNGGYTIPADTVKPHEAHLLKLDISKAVNQLDWRPALSFDETVEFTVGGYNDDLKGQDILNKRVEQIVSYTAKASKKGIEWAQ
ncbi:CDP-glucose 4,6-dehydratase [Mucilaginibacter myungsuensis]|uniref:CDP-glucose 4,6-dehydratase n=1 Tax=Mucilaginibacter myungsuensis TaxID=649104 RepID=A0A929PWR8_9SPHI|nr:CDP-glucose 4,6-dehydratase [Mucilaginibacter myungsuensis]MBE9662419.1 CDP-glucose 4,6-dehydratase [Mucilaginibacter myungsuensis]MDN3599144.1 CDP-glucose 4,6-dehydratase [Mucilaginibacter myungsuensis]